MKTFILKLLIFLLPLMLLLTYLEFKVSQIPTYLSQKKGYFETQLDNIEVVSTGLSYGNSIDPQFFDHKGFNLFNDAEDLYYDIQVIEKYLGRLPKLKLVILPISYFSLEYRLDRSPWAWRAPFYKFIFNIPPQDSTSLFNPGFYSYTAAYGWHEVLNYIKNGFSGNMNNILHHNGWREVGTKGIIDSPESIRQGRQNIEYIESILMDDRTNKTNKELISGFIEFCQSRKIKVILVTPPFFHTYYDFIDPVKYGRMQDNIKILTEKHQIPYHNFLKDGRFVSDDFYTGDHVNNHGAEKFSRILNEIINNYLSI